MRQRQPWTLYCEGGGGDCEEMATLLALDLLDLERVAQFYGWTIFGFNGVLCPDCLAIEHGQWMRTVTYLGCDSAKHKVWRVKQPKVLQVSKGTDNGKQD